MAASTSEISLELRPKSRLDVIDVASLIEEQHGDILAPYPKAFYCSFHTTAGYLDQRICSRLNNSRDSVQAFLRGFQTLFPPGANYHHDQLHLRSELTEEERENEPLNADSHLTFISSGLENCVPYRHAHGQPVFFVDLDGVNGAVSRRRKSTVIGFHDQELVDRIEIDVPVSRHGIDSINLRDTRLGLYERIQHELERYEIEQGWVEITLEPEERHAGLTVNEFETLLMRQDLAEVLKNPLGFMAERGRSILRDPRSIPYKARNYAKYDFVQVVNEFLDALGLNESIFERLIDRLMAVPASRFLRMKRSVRLLVADADQSGHGSIIHGTYQSPILVQWKRSHSETRKLQIAIFRLI